MKNDNNTVIKRPLTSITTPKSHLRRKNIEEDFKDELERNEDTMREKTRELNKIKENTIKDFVYSNKKVPENWRRKSDFRDNVLSLFVEDSDFLNYLGMGGPGSTKNGGGLESQNISSTPKNKTFFRSYTNLSSNPTKNKIKEVKSKLLKNTREDSKYDMKEQIIIQGKFGKPIKKYITKNEILNILDDYKDAYPIQEKLEDIYPGKFSFHSKKKLKNKDEFYLANLFNSNRNISEKKKLAELEKTNKYAVIKKTFDNSVQFKKKKLQQTFKEGIYTNLVPNFSKDSQFCDKKSSILKKFKSNLNNVILSENDKFIQKIKIRTPLLEKNLEGIHFFGPYYSHCPPCRNKNIDFYNKLKQNQCFNLIQYIKNKKNNFAIKLEHVNK